MTPKKAAAFLRENFSKSEQLAELSSMLSAGGRVTTLAHGIAVELRLIEHEDLEEPLQGSLTLKAVSVSDGYGSATMKDAAERSPFAGKGPMYARMGSEEVSISESLGTANATNTTPDDGPTKDDDAKD